MSREDAELLALLHEGLRRFVVEQRWAFSAIQRAAIPAISKGEDCVIEAPTAGGKTEAVLWPALTRAAVKRKESVRVLYLAPLRALLNNLELRVVKYSQLCHLEAFKWHGDVSQSEKLIRLRRVPHVLITTPESLEAIMLRKAQWRHMFEDLQTIVLDEAHSFAAGDRGGHVLALLARLDAAVKIPAQRIAVSATIGNPDAMLRWLVGSGRPPARRISAAAEVRDERYRVEFFDESADSEKMPPERHAGFRRLDALYRALAGRGASDVEPRDAECGARRSIVFVPSRRSAETFAKALHAFANQVGLPSLRVRTHHSSVSKYFREEAEQLIQLTTEGGLDAILSTSTLELGIDIGELSAVIQCDALASSSAFLQRVGRTGRRAGRPRAFLGLCTRTEDLLLLTATVNLGRARQSEALALPTRAFHLLAHQLLCLSLQEHGVNPSRAWDMLSRTHVFSGIDRREFDELIEHMMASSLLRDEAGVLVISDEGERRFLGAGWRRLFAVFDSAPMYEVMEGKTQVGMLDASFVEGLESPFLFVLGGRLWEATRVDAKARAVAARRARGGEAPKWTSFGGPDVPFETAREVGRIVHEGQTPAFLGDEAIAALRNEQQRLDAVLWRPDVMVATTTPTGLVTLWTYAGDRINRTLARYTSIDLSCKATASYRCVEVHHPIGVAEAALDRTVASLDRLRSERMDARALAQRLEESLQPWPFSPFARCLPKRLLRSALMERVLDIPGLFSLLNEVKIAAHRA